MNTSALSRAALALASLSVFLHAAPAVVKLHDFDNTDPLGNPGPEKPQAAPLLIGSKLWFTTESGGDFGFGTLCSYNLDNGALDVLMSFDNDTGNTPKSAPRQVGNLLYFTTSRGGEAGIGDRGGLGVWNMDTGSYELLWTSPATEDETTGITPPNGSWGEPGIIDRGGALGQDIYIACYYNGSGGNGGIYRYQTDDGSSTLIHEFQGIPGDGAKPYRGFTVVGTDLYFTTFNGGNDDNGFLSSGNGILGRIDASVRGAETVTTVAEMGDIKEEGLPGNNPYYRAADHSLYFTTVRNALMKYDISRDTLTRLLTWDSSLGGNTYSNVVEWDNWLYFGGISGGEHSSGTIARYHLVTGAHEVILDFDRSNDTIEPNMGRQLYGGFTFNEDPLDPAFYLLPKTGGDHNHGTILRIDLDLPATPSPYENWLAQFDTTGVDTTLGADPDHDGRDNRTEFAYGSSPVDGGDGNGFSLASEGGSLEIRWTALSGSGVSYLVTGSPTLGAAPSPWTPVAGTQEIMAVPDVSVPSGYERRRMTLP
ncbi:MAG: hypothetical protein KDN05_18305, partial [Verrucomicrobiae bacterium]|nr:hypothetical protein [Verrucomicrobiae bacterium]